MSLISDIKTKIKAKLDALVTATTLGEVFVDDFKATSIFDRDYGAYPVAVLTSPSLENIAATNRDNLRKHIFQILVIMKGENVATAYDVENLMETIVNEFDNDPTLTGTADGGVEPSTSIPEPVVSRGKSYIAFSITIRASAIKSLSFT